MGRNAVDPVRRLTLALLLASVAALGALVDDAPVDDDRDVSTPSLAAREAPRQLGTATIFDERRCTERGLASTAVSLVGLVRRP